jgi:hypothetical protein
MSFNRENVTWQSKDGTWNMAFFRTIWVGSEADGFDPEWDVQYDYKEFNLYAYAKGRATPEDAWNVATKRTSNPGGTNLVSRAMNREACEKYDAMLEAAIGKDILKEQDAVRLERWSPS